MICQKLCQNSVSGLGSVEERVIFRRRAEVWQEQLKRSPVHDVVPERWGSSRSTVGTQRIAKLVHATPISMVYNTYMTIFHTVYKPTYKGAGPH